MLSSAAVTPNFCKFEQNRKESIAPPSISTIQSSTSTSTAPSPSASSQSPSLRSVDITILLQPRYARLYNYSLASLVYQLSSSTSAVVEVDSLTTYSPPFGRLVIQSSNHPPPPPNWNSNYYSLRLRLRSLNC